MANRKVSPSYQGMDYSEEVEKRPEPTVNELEEFAQYQANESGATIALVRRFIPTPADHDEVHTEDGAMPVLHWGVVLDSEYAMAEVTTDIHGHILKFEFTYQKGTAGPDIVPFLISIIDWLTDTRHGVEEEPARHNP